MTEQNTNIYEAMFLFPQSMSADMSAAIEHIKQIMTRAEAEIIGMSKWGERNLAYEIGKQKRGLYILTYFRARTSQMPNIERDCNLSEMLLRFMFTRTDHLSMDEITSTEGREMIDLEAKLRSADDAEPVAAASEDAG